MKETLAYIGIMAGIIVAIVAMVLGSYMPMTKSNLYISSLKDLQNVKSTGEFENLFKPALTYPSPIGQEEITKYLGSDILGIIQQNQSEDVNRELVNYIEPYLEKDNVRHLLLAGEYYMLLWGKYHKEVDYKKSEQYYLEAEKIGPQLPPVLYSLLQLYQSHNDKTGIQRVGNEILKTWDDPAVRALMK